MERYETVQCNCLSSYRGRWEEVHWRGNKTTPNSFPTDFSVVLVTLLDTQVDHSRFTKCRGDIRRQANTWGELPIKGHRPRKQDVYLLLHGRTEALPEPNKSTSSVPLMCIFLMKLWDTCTRGAIRAWCPLVGPVITDSAAQLAFREYHNWQVHHWWSSLSADNCCRQQWQVPTELLGAGQLEACTWTAH